MQSRHLDSLDKRSKCGRSASRSLKVALDRHFHLMNLGRSMLEARGITDVVIQQIAEALRWRKLEDIDVVQGIRGLDTVEESVRKSLEVASELELIALADAVEMMFSRYQINEPQ